MNLLFLIHRTPYPPNRGDRIRSFHLVEYLASRSNLYLGFLAESTPDEETLGVLRHHAVEVAGVPLGRLDRWVRGAGSLALGRTATEGLFYSPQLWHTVRSWAAQVRFDAVVVFCSSMAQYLDVPGLAGVPAIVDLVDVDSQKFLDYADHARGLRRLLYRLEGRRLRRLEASLARRAQAIVVVSPQEAALFRSFCAEGRVEAIANGVDLDYFRPPADELADDSSACVFVGALDYRANLDGLRWFVGEVWPGVHRQLPQATFRIVGSRPGSTARRLAETPGVELIGEVPDVRPLVADAALSVAPLRVARGIQNKVLEAMAMGKAVLASPQALEGLEITPGEHACQAVSADEWIAQIVRLLHDPSARQRMGRAGRRVMEQRYAWAGRLEQFGAVVGMAERIRESS